MKNKIKSKAISVKNHVKENKWTYGWAAAAVGVVALQQRNLKLFYEFLEEKGIDPMEYYCPEFLAEMNS
jgi:hypothetical protein